MTRSKNATVGRPLRWHASSVASTYTARRKSRRVLIKKNTRKAGTTSWVAAAVISPHRHHSDPEDAQRLQYLSVRRVVDEETRNVVPVAPARGEKRRTKNERITMAATETILHHVTLSRLALRLRPTRSVPLFRSPFAIGDRGRHSPSPGLLRRHCRFSRAVRNSLSSFYRNGMIKLWYEELFLIMVLPA